MIPMPERRSQRSKPKIEWPYLAIALLAFAALAVLFLLAAARYSAARPEEARALYIELTGAPDALLKTGVLGPATSLAGTWEEEEEAVTEPEVPVEEPEKLPEADPAIRIPNTVDFAALWERNMDVCAWITVPGTLVDYPVLQHPTDDEYYLNHTIDHAAGLPGSIYSEAIHPKDFSAVHTILYGHNMKNDTMFGSLHDYENPEFFTEHPYIYIHQPGRTLVYEIFAAVNFRSTYLPNYLNYEEEAGFTAYIEELKASPGNIVEGMEIPFGSRILTLHTCIGNDKSHRYLVVGVLIGAY